jgi:DNA modification methylase
LLEGVQVDSIVTDPPYELGFMGKTWDRTGIAYNRLMWKLCFDLLKPGGHLPFAGSGTTGQAAIEEGFKPILIEREQEYIKDIEERLNGNQGIGTKVSTTNVP